MAKGSGGGDEGGGDEGDERWRHGHVAPLQLRLLSA